MTSKIILPDGDSVDLRRSVTDVALVYILRSGEEDLFKIGRTRRDLAARIKQLSTGNSHRLTLFDLIETEDDAACEAYLHGTLQSKRCMDGEAREFFALPPAELEDAIRGAREYVTEVLPRRREAERLAKEESDGRILRPGHEEWARYRRLLQVRESEHRLGVDRLRLENELKLAIGTAAGLDDIATWTTHSVRKLDEASFRLSEPALYQAFVRESRTRTFRLL
jgi:hypothetical protein